jgi:hypothetical protein
MKTTSSVFVAAPSLISCNTLKDDHRGAEQEPYYTEAQFQSKLSRSPISMADLRGSSDIGQSLSWCGAGGRKDDVRFAAALAYVGFWD